MIDKYRYINKFTKGIDRVVQKVKKASDQICIICMEPLLNSHQIIQCGHLFHYKCLFQWVQTKEECPVCRVRINLNLWGLHWLPSSLYIVFLRMVTDKHNVSCSTSHSVALSSRAWGGAWHRIRIESSFINIICLCSWSNINHSNGRWFALPGPRSTLTHLRHHQATLRAARSLRRRISPVR